MLALPLLESCPLCPQHRASLELARPATNATRPRGSRPDSGGLAGSSVDGPLPVAGELRIER